MRRLGLLGAAMVLAAISVFSFSPVGAAVAAAPTFDPVLERQLSAASATDELLVYVSGPDIATSIGALVDARVRVADRFDRIGVAVGVGTAAEIDRLRASTAAISVGGDPGITFFLDTSHVATRAAEADTVFVGAPGPHDGAGVSVAIIDGGVDGTHPMFQGGDGASKVIRNLEVVCTLLSACGDGTRPANEQTVAAALAPIDSPTNNTDDVAGHGTHVAGIAAGYPVEVDGRHIQGAAPGAKIVALSVATAGSTYYGALAAQYWVLLHHRAPCDGMSSAPAECPPIRSVNNSYGPDCSAGDCPFTVDTEARIQDQLSDEGVAMVWAAGNDAGDGSIDTLNPPAKDPHPGVIGVASYNDEDDGGRDHGLSSFSSRGMRSDATTYPDLSAPGDTILSSCASQQVGDCYLGFVAPGYSVLSGTSMAAPHIAGYAARLFGANPALTAGELENVLEDTAYKFVAGGPYRADPANADDTTSFDKGHGLVDVTAALAAVTGTIDPNPPVAPTCAASSVQLTDPAGDSTGLLLATTPLPSDDTTDVTKAWVTYAPAAAPTPAALTFHVRGTGLRADDAPPNRGVGEAFDLAFWYADTSFYVRVTHTFPAAATYALRQAAGGAAGTSDVTIAGSGITGTWNATPNEITMTVPADAFKKATPALPAATAPSVLDTFSIISYHQLGAPANPAAGQSLLAGADSGDGSCTFVVGTSAPDPDAGPDPDIPEAPLAIALPAAALALGAMALRRRRKSEKPVSSV